jgi:hypothetical protein
MKRSPVTEKTLEYIRKAHAHGVPMVKLAKQVGVTRHTIANYLSGKSQIHRCQYCRKRINRGSCCVDCRPKHDAKLHRLRNRDKVIEYLNNYRKTHDTNLSGKMIELTCSICGKPFLRRASYQKYLNRVRPGKPYCSKTCFYARWQVEQNIKITIKNIEALSKLIDKPEPEVPIRFNQAPEYYDHMKEE